MKQKETMFEKISKAITLIGNFIMMNLLFLVACLPVVTIGQAWCGLFSAVRYNIRGEKWFTGFKIGFKTRFWRGILAWLLILPFFVILFLDVTAYFTVEQFTVELVIRLIASAVMFLVTTGLLGALLLLNVYIPTTVGNWIRNGVGMVFQVPLQLMAAGGLMWMPLLLAFLAFNIFYYFVMVFVVAYFTLAAVGNTMLMKQALLDCLVEARANGTLLQEEGKNADKETPAEREDTLDE